MNRQEYSRIEAKRRQVVNQKKKQFVSPVYEQQDYKHRLNFYSIPPTADITLEDFETWAIDRLKGIHTDLSLCSLTVASELMTINFT